MRAKKNEAPAVRCAVYTRKSTEDGLEQEFNSLDAQREAAEAFIASQRGEGWICLPDQYNECRPHSALGNLTPREYARSRRPRAFKPRTLTLQVV